MGPTSSSTPTAGPTAPPTFSSVEAYHVYEINHEVGHVLGHEHEYCAGAGLTSPVMAQQSRTREGGCTENGWPTRDNQAP